MSLTANLTDYMERLPSKGCLWLDQLIIENDRGYEKVVDNIFDKTNPCTVFFRGEITDESTLVAIGEWESGNVFTIEKAMAGYWMVRYEDLDDFLWDAPEEHDSYATLNEAVADLCAFFGIGKAVYTPIHTAPKIDPMAELNKVLSGLTEASQKAMDVEKATKAKSVKRPDSFGAFS